MVQYHKFWTGTTKAVPNTGTTYSGLYCDFMF